MACRAQKSTITKQQNQVKINRNEIRPANNLLFQQPAREEEQKWLLLADGVVVPLELWH
jgi:hypothetical protein